MCRHEDAIALAFTYMLQWSSAEEVATICIALADVFAIAELGNAERALVRWEEKRGLPVGTVAFTIIK